MANNPHTPDFSGRIAIVNGASRGIGEAIARGLADCGAHVVCTSRSVDSVQPVVDDIVAAGGSAEARACHAGRLEDIDALFGWIAGRHGRLDLLVNNAATNPYFGAAAKLPPDAFDKTVEVNLKGPYYFMSRAVPYMAEDGGGAIVNVSSIAAIATMPGQGVYSMTKAGLVSLTKSFAKEYGRVGIRVNTVLPGIVETRFAEALTSNPEVQQWLARLPVPRAGQPADIVGGVLYLLSDQAAYTTGASLVMDGGATLGMS